VSAVSSAGAPPPEPRHGVRIAAIWVVANAVLVPIVIWVLGPHIPPGQASVQATDQHNINIALTALATPVILFIWVYFAYALTVFRQRGEEIVDGPPLEGHARVQLVWLSVTTVLVIGLAVLGTIELFSGSAAGAGGGEGPNPISKPSDFSSALEVQVIGQQWLWTFRYPAYGGVETSDLVLPVNREIAFHVTSLDVAHSFWAYELGVKADAVPGTDNVAFAKPLQIRSLQVRCAELCGLWHGHMNLSARVVSQSDFSSWIAQQQSRYSGVTRQLPPYSHTYYPDPLRRSG
jgi:cytochrome c oxidase subunit 2